MEKVKEIPFKRVDPEALPPTRMTTGAVGYDLYVSQGVTIPPGKGELIPTGIAFEFPEGWFATVHLRSSMCKRGLLGSVGVVDEDFRGTVRVQAFNMTDEDILIVPGERIGQIVFHKYHLPTLVEVDRDLEPTERGDKGFGSTGK